MTSPFDLSAMSSDGDVDAAVRANRLWYHTMELRPGIVTPGWFDLRPILGRLPWPEVRGKRCLDIGTYDGCLALELERRGADEVIATDISDHALWDWPATLRAEGPARLTEIAGEKGRGFDIAVRATGSRVRKVEQSVYDLDPDGLGRFDVVVCGSLLLHLRDPLRALEAIRRVCSGVFLSMEQINALLTLSHPRRPILGLDGVSEQVQWHVPNLAGHRRMITAAGFQIGRTVRPYALPLGPAHPPVGSGLRLAYRKLVCRVVTGGFGVPHSAVLAAPFDRGEL